jgi:hypothetical protein
MMITGVAAAGLPLVAGFGCMSIVLPIAALL